MDESQAAMAPISSLSRYLTMDKVGNCPPCSLGKIELLPAAAKNWPSSVMFKPSRKELFSKLPFRLDWLGAERSSGFRSRNKTGTWRSKPDGGVQSFGTGAPT